MSPPKTDAGRRGGDHAQGGGGGLAAHLEKYADPDPDALVFTTRRGAHLLHSPFNRLVWRPAVKQLALDGLRVQGTQRARRRR